MAEILTSEKFVEVVKNNKVVVVDFFATWCGPCKMLGPVIDKVADELKGKAIVAKVDVDQEPNLAAKFNVMSVPSVFIIVNGEVKDSFAGYRQKDQILSIINQYL